MMGKIIITGPGRAGTTFLVQLLTRLGFDTGFEAGKEPYMPELRAGCEYNVHWDLTQESPEDVKAKIAAAPRVLKSPEWGLCLKWLVSNNLIEVDHVFIPFRDLDVSAHSRLDVGLDWLVGPELEGEARVLDQAQILAMVLGRTIEACYVHELPCTVLRFPLFVKDIDYCYGKLMDANIGLRLGNEQWWNLKKAFDSLARPEQIKWKP